MATFLERYQNTRKEVEKRIAAGSISSEAVWWYGELTYRIGVLETFQTCCNTAPATVDIPALQEHYQILDAFIQCLASERRYGPSRGPDTQKEREAAQNNLGRVIQNYRKRFSSFTPSAPETYRYEVDKLIKTFLPAWLQFRETFVQLTKTKKKEAS